MQNDTSTPNTNTEQERNTPVAQELKEESAEDKEIRAQIESFDRFPKLRKWATLFTDKNNKATYGNRTESAMQAYDCKDRFSAMAIGSQNFRKLKGLASMFMENSGKSFEDLINVILARAMTSERRDWMDLALEITDYKDPKGTPSIAIQNNVQTNIQVGEAEKVDFDAAFKEFIKNS